MRKARVVSKQSMSLKDEKAKKKRASDAAGVDEVWVGSWNQPCSRNAQDTGAALLSEIGFDGASRSPGWQLNVRCSETYEVQLVATKAIKPGEQILVTYAGAPPRACGCVLLSGP